MKRKTKFTAVVATTVALGVGVLTGCASDAEVASRNLSTAADQFQIDRRIVFYNGVTDAYILEIVGRCSIEDQPAEYNAGQLEVTCQTGPTEYKKHFFGKADNTPYFVEQLGAAEADVYRYDVIFKPTSVVPDINTVTP